MTHPALPATPAELARLIDHTLLKPDATRAELEQLCQDARKHQFAAVGVNSARVAFCARQLAGSNVAVAAGIGFPFGASSSIAKVEETRAALADGARELDMVLNLGALKDGDDALVSREIGAVVGAINQFVGATTPGQRPAPVLLKVILECCLLTEAEKIRTCQLAVEAGAHSVKTSTGYGKTGATEADVQLLRAHVPAPIGVTASGGIRTLAEALALLKAGATRLGCFNSLTIIREAGCAIS